MGPRIDQLGVTLLDASLGVALLTSVVALAMLGCRQPARRIALARAAILGTLALIPLTVFAPLPRLELVRILEASGLRAHPLLPQSRTRLLYRLPPPDRQQDHRVKGGACHRPRIVAIGEPSKTVTVLYLGGVGGGLAWLLFGYWGLGWLTRRSWEPSPAAAALYESLACYSRRGRPRLRVATRVQRPVLLGLFRQTILIPVGLDVPEAGEQLRLSLLHELAHSERRDPWFSLASGLAQAFWFFLPPLWWIRAQMRLDQEFLADRHAAHGFGPLQVYASSLLGLAGPAYDRQPSAPSGKPAAPVARSSLFQRVLMLIRCPFPIESSPPRWWSRALPCLVILGTLAASTLSLQIPEDASGPPAPPNQGSTKRTLPVRRLTVVGRPAPFELPMRLPDQFLLELDVWGRPDSLSQTRVIGHRLSVPEPPPQAAPPADDWHRVRIRRDSSGLSLSVDGHHIPTDPQATTTPQLTVQPPLGHLGYFINMLLTW